MEVYKKTFSINSWEFFLDFLLLLAIILSLVFSQLKETVALGMSGVLVGLMGIFGKQIIEIVYRPRLLIKVGELMINNGRQYNLFIKNYGRVALKTELKIRDSEDKEWINLKIPFGDLLKCNPILVERIARGEEVSFNLCHFYEFGNGIFFDINPTVYPSNQNFVVGPKAHKTFLIQIVACNIKPINFKVIVTNRGYESTVKINNFERIF